MLVMNTVYNMLTMNTIESMLVVEQFLAHAVRSWPEKHMAGACHSSSASVSFTLQLSTSNCAASTVYPQDP